MLFKNKSNKVVLSIFFLLIPFLLAITAFQTKNPRLSNLQTASFDNRPFIDAFKADTLFSAIDVPPQPESGLKAEVTGSVRVHSAAPALPTSAPMATSTTESSLQTPSPTRQDTLNHLFLEVEVPPSPVDGMTAFLKYIGLNYKYPEAAVKEGVKGRMLIGFVVEKDGGLSDIKILEDLGFGTGDEAVRVVKNGPKWKAGIQNGIPVRVQFSLPIVLNMGGNN
jgi:TonB family protein